MKMFLLIINILLIFPALAQSPSLQPNKRSGKFTKTILVEPACLISVMAERKP